MFGKKNNGYDDGYRQAREDAAQDLLNKMTELSMMNKRFAQTLIDTVRGK
jgi:flagellar biosynthesis/type III secretory pathway protein FliH